MSKSSITILAVYWKIIPMIEDDWQDNAISLFERLLPPVSSVLLMLLAYVPVYMGIFNNIRADLGLIAIYFWMLNRADLFDLKSVVFMGLVDGTLSSSVFGLELFAYLLMYVLTLNLRKFLVGRSFLVIWYGFMAITLVVLLLKWSVAAIYYGQFLPFTPLMFSYLQNAAIYPLISVLLALLQNMFLQDDEI